MRNGVAAWRRSETKKGAMPTGIAPFYSRKTVRYFLSIEIAPGPVTASASSPPAMLMFL